MREKEKGLHVEFNIPCTTLIAANTMNESVIPESPMDPPASAKVKARAHFLLNESVSFPTNSPNVAKGTVYASPVSIP